MAGAWISEKITSHGAPGNAADFLIGFDVDSSNRSVTNFALYDTSALPPGSLKPGSATTTGGRLTFEQRYEGSCNGVQNMISLEVVFRSATSADAKYKVTNPGSGGSILCEGVAEGDVKFRRR